MNTAVETILYGFPANIWLHPGYRNFYILKLSYTEGHSITLGAMIYQPFLLVISNMKIPFKCLFFPLPIYIQYIL